MCHGQGCRYIGDKRDLPPLTTGILQGGPLPIISEVISPINGLING